MKVIMIAPYPEDKSKVTGGVEAVTVNLISGFTQFANTIDLTVISVCPGLKVATDTKVESNIRVIRLPLVPQRYKRLALYFITRKTVRRLIASIDPEIIHIQGNGPQLLLTRGLPKENIVLTQHGIISEERKNQLSAKGRLIYRVNSWIDRWCSKDIRNFIFISRYNRQLTLAGIKQAVREQLIANPVNSAFFNAEKINPTSNNILFVGGVRKGKGLLDLLKAVAQLTDIDIHYCVDVVGGVLEFAYDEQVQEFIDKNNLRNRVCFHEWISPRRLLELYEHTSILVLPSLQENLPVCIAEAMAAGRVVVATKVGGIPEMISDGRTGFLFEKGNIAQLSEILTRLNENPALRLQVAEAAQKDAANRYSAEAVAKQTLAFYQSVIERL